MRSSSIIRPSHPFGENGRGVEMAGTAWNMSVPRTIEINPASTNRRRIRLVGAIIGAIVTRMWG
jgi:hypothetical protein